MDKKIRDKPPIGGGKKLIDAKNLERWRTNDSKGPSTFLGSYQRCRVEGRRGRTYWEWKSAELRKGTSGEDGDDETSLESCSKRHEDRNCCTTTGKLEEEGNPTEEWLEAEAPAEHKQKRGQSLYSGRGSEANTVPAVGGQARVLSPSSQLQLEFHEHQHQPQSCEKYRYQQPGDDYLANKCSNDCSAELSKRPIAKVKVTSYVQPKFCATSNSFAGAATDYIIPSAPPREEIYSKGFDCNEPTTFNSFVVKKGKPQGKSASPASILKKRDNSSAVQVHSPINDKKKLEETHFDVRQELREKLPIPGKSSSSSPASNYSPRAQRTPLPKVPENIFNVGPDGRSNIFNSSSAVKKPDNFSVFRPTQDQPSSSVVFRNRPIRRGAERESGALVWISQPAGGAKLDWIPTPNLSTLRSQPLRPGARVTRQDSDASLSAANLQTPISGGDTRMQSFPSTASRVGGPATTCSPPILKHTSSHDSSSSSKNVHRSASGSARPDGRSQTIAEGVDEDCVVSVPGRTSGQIVRIRVRPEVHAYLAGLPVTSSPGLGERRDSSRSLHSAHSSSASGLTGCSESGGEGSAGYNEPDYSAVVDEYTLLQKAVVEHDQEAMRLLTAAEAAVDPRQKLLMAAGQ